MKPLLLIALLCAAAPTGASAQQDHTHQHSSHAGTARADGTVLTPDEVASLRNGEGMGLARAAELNHWPGPRHVIDLAGKLDLDDETLAAVQEIFDRMHEAAVLKGEEIIGVERHLATAFASGEVSADRVAMLTTHLGALRGELQAIHLTAHLETRVLLTDEQVAEYDRLRGYAEGAGQVQN